MIKNSLLISTAIVGLLAGAQLASAQSPSGQPPGQKIEQPAAPDSGKSSPGASTVTPSQQSPSSTGSKESATPPKGQAQSQGAPSTLPKGQAQGQGSTQTKPPSTAQSGQAPDSERLQGKTGQREDRKPGATTGQRDDRNPSKAMGQGELQGKERNESGTAGRPSTAQQPSENRMGQQPSDNKMGQSSTSTTNVNVNLSPEQRTKIRETVITRSDAPRVSRSNINFELNVGTAVPHSVHVVALPDEVITIHPAWRGFMYFLVGDEIVVVEPGTLRIVAVLPA
jgi:uncharacterized protein DUF1236